MRGGVIGEKDTTEVTCTNHTERRNAKQCPLLEKNEGKIPVFIQLFSNGSKSSVYALNNNRVDLSTELFKDLNNLFGEDSFRIIPK